MFKILKTRQSKYLNILEVSVIMLDSFPAEYTDPQFHDNGKLCFLLYVSHGIACILVLLTAMTILE